MDSELVYNHIQPCLHLCVLAITCISYHAFARIFLLIRQSTFACILFVFGFTDFIMFLVSKINNNYKEYKMLLTI